MQRFPIPSSSVYSYQRRFDRREGGHHGTDIFADKGTPVVAVEDGAARRSRNPKGGLVVYLLNVKTGNHYYYAHLNSVDETLPEAPDSIPVKAGTILGTVGTSGNARGTAPHLHFQMRTKGTLVDPFDALSAVDVKPHGERATPEPDTDFSGEGVHIPGAGTISVSGIVVALVLAGVAWFAFGSHSEKRGRYA